jgi:hypothetical protein
MCVVSKSNRFFFIHIPKNAGGSVRQALIRNAGGKKPRGVYQHTPAVTVCDLNRSQWNSFLTFSFIRNPWERMWSIYKFNLERKGKGHEDVGKSFDEFLMRKKRTHNWAKTFPNPNTPIQRRPQTDWLLDENGEMIVDFIGRFENLHDDFKRICSMVGIKPPRLTRTHKTSHSVPYTKAYSKEGIEFVEEHFRTDIEMFEYAFR